MNRNWYTWKISSKKVTVSHFKKLSYLEDYTIQNLERSLLALYERLKISRKPEMLHHAKQVSNVNVNSIENKPLIWCATCSRYHRGIHDDSLVKSFQKRKNLKEAANQVEQQPRKKAKTMSNNELQKALVE